MAFFTVCNLYGGEYNSTGWRMLDLDDHRFFITAGGLNAMMDPISCHTKEIRFEPKKDRDFRGNCSSIMAVKNAQGKIIAQVKEMFARPERQLTLALMWSLNGEIPTGECVFLFVQKFNPNNYSSPKTYELRVPVKEVMPEFDEQHALALLDERLKKCSDARKMELGWAEYLGFDDKYVTLRYDYAASDFASEDEVIQGILELVNERIMDKKYTGGSGIDSVEHLAMVTRKDVRLIFRNTTTGKTSTLEMLWEDFKRLRSDYTMSKLIEKSKNLMDQRSSGMVPDNELKDRLDIILKNYLDERDKDAPEYTPESLVNIISTGIKELTYHWYDFILNKYISKEEVLKLIVANTECGRNPINRMISPEVSRYGLTIKICPDKGKLKCVEYKFTQRELYEALKDKYER